MCITGSRNGKVEFKAEYGSILGKLKISFPDLYTADYLLFTLLRKSLENRLGGIINL
jgi:hypothetical protein